MEDEERSLESCLGEWKLLEGSLTTCVRFEDVHILTSKFMCSKRFKDNCAEIQCPEETKKYNPKD